MTIPLLEGLRPLAPRYEGFILDVWGVIHDGGAAFPEALGCLRALRAAGKRVAFVSNAPRRAARVAEVLEEKGVAPELYDAVLSSGEVTREALAHRCVPALAALGRRCLVLAPPADSGLLEGLAHVPVASPGEADFILAIGFRDAAEPLSAYEGVFEAALARGLLMICANPDRVVLRRGRPELCAGALAERYAERGGRVVYFGKPHPAIFGAALSALGTAPGRTLVAGDGLATDILGAKRAGLDSLLVTGGVMAEELGLPRDELPSAEAVAAACRALEVRPVAAVPALRWA